MLKLTVWTFGEPDAARAAEQTLGRLAAREPMAVEDAAVVTWPARARRPRSRPLNQLARTSPVGDAFWGLLFGVAFYGPLLGAQQDDRQPLDDALTTVGVDRELVALIRRAILPGTSGLFLLADEQVVPLVQDALLPTVPRRVEQELDAGQAARLRAVFGAG